MIEYLTNPRLFLDAARGGRTAKVEFQSEEDARAYAGRLRKVQQIRAGRGTLEPLDACWITRGGCTVTATTDPAMVPACTFTGGDAA